MDNRARAFRATAIKLGAFAVVMLLVFVGLVVVFSRYRPGSSNDYTATFASASAIKSGSKVKIAGVEVGSVNSVELTRDNQAEIGFSVDQKYVLPASVRAMVRYENLTGDRYLELQRGSGDTAKTLSDGAHIPIEQTQPALDLDKLVGGFKPLFRTLNAEEANELTSSLISVFQGQGAGLTQLLSNTAQFTNSLADRDQLIGSVIDNLNRTLGTIDGDRQGLDTSVDLLQQLVSGLASQRGTIGNALTQTAKVTNGLSDLLSATRPDLKRTIAATGTTSEELLKAEPFIRQLISRLPEDYLTLSNLGSYGAWLQIYFCRIRLLFSGPNGTQVFFTAADLMGNKSKAGGRCAT
ncbi:MCE family protein [Gordonia sp. ABSL1-1]|uniref:MCE family protein n=1 Tax=Gordonia sp. ABSL1-1 TaxID=3053923 RepID=UPI0025738F89|nr:MCE family protein [Gordonia sp. ABSL1-1]MDL9936497.1 MCE family protein [Gordonia sp. ABSL1-1]